MSAAERQERPMRKPVFISHGNKRAVNTLAHYLNRRWRPSYGMKNNSFGAGTAG
jgi:hypothetical protein